MNSHYSVNVNRLWLCDRVVQIKQDHFTFERYWTALF